jgi:hypothetical protein
VGKKSIGFSCSQKFWQILLGVFSVDEVVVMAARIVLNSTFDRTSCVHVSTDFGSDDLITGNRN